MCVKHSKGVPEPTPPFSGLFLDAPAKRGISVTSVNTVLGIRIDRAEVFDVLCARLTDFKNAGGGAIVDATGMFEGRDLRLYEALSRATGVHIVATTGQGPEAMLGGYFLTPQTNPPTPWPANKFAEMFGKEINWSVVLRLEWLQRL
jgi:phosphotriesterase-related protein